MSLQATTFEFAPERIDLLSLVLSAAGLGALVGSVYGRWRGLPRGQRAVKAEDFALASAGTVAFLFPILLVIQALT